MEIRDRLGWAEIFSLICNFSLFLLIFVHLIVLFYTIYGPFLLFSLFFYFFSTLSAKRFQFQLNKLFSNESKWINHEFNNRKEKVN